MIVMILMMTSNTFVNIVICFLCISSIDCWSFSDNHEEFRYISSGLSLPSPNDYATMRFSFSAQSASFCAFVKSLNNDNKVIFTLRNMDDSKTFKIVHHEDNFFFTGEHFKRSVYIQKHFENKFVKICFIRGNSKRSSIFEINPANVDRNWAGLSTQYKDESDEPRYKVMEFIIGDITFKNISFKGTVAGLYITRELTDDFRKYATFDCLKEDPSKQNHKFEDLATWSLFLSSVSHFQSSTTVVSFFEMCETHYDVLVINDIVKYKGIRHSLCKKLNGRALTPHEVVRYNTSLLPIVEAQCKSPKGHSFTLIWHNDCELFDIRHIYKRISSCMPHHACFLCLYQPSNQYNFYYQKGEESYPNYGIGALSPFELLKKGATKFNPDNIMWKNKENAMVYPSDQHWVLQFGDTADKWHTTNKPLPIGKHYWYSSNVNMLQSLTFSTKFASTDLPCDNGEESYPSRNYCDGNGDCEDGSDENCPLYSKLYYDFNNHRLKTPVMKISLLIDEIDNFYEYEGYKRLKLQFTFNWIDMGIYYWEKTKKSYFKCSSLTWSPRLYFSSDCTGNSGTNEPYKWTNHHDFCQAILINETYLSKHLPDGVYYGENAVNLKKSSVELYIPCVLSYRSYPFGSQNCQFCFGIKNSKDYNLVYTPQEELQPTEGNFYSNDFIAILTAVKTENLNQIKATVTFNSKSGYYIVTGYIPSIFLILISYATLYFRRDMPNMKIIVSLVTFISIIVLYLNVNSDVIKTSYVKMLDVWFIALSLFSIVVMGYNCFFNSLVSHTRAVEGKRNKNQDYVDDFNVSDIELEISQRWENVMRYKVISRIAFPIVFVMFVICYIIIAATNILDAQ